MVRTKRWKLVHFLNEPFGQLFDLQNDPQENSNLWSSKDHSTVKQELMDTLLLWRMESQSSKPRTYFVNTVKQTSYQYVL
jgi:arylsulfatase A-like enzyme